MCLCGNDFNPKRWLGVLLVAIVAIGINFDAAYGMVVLWLTTDTYMHGAFVLPLAAIMAKQKPWPTVLPSPLNIGFSALLIIGWMMFVIVGHLSMMNVVQQFALLSVIPLVVLLCYGLPIAWHYRAPLLLIFFAIPVGDFLVPFLQSITADMSVFFLQMSGVSVLRNGWYISIPAADFRVAEACSGINFLISTFTVAVFYAFTYMEKTYKRIAFIAMGLIVPLLANGVRVYLIIMIANWGNVEAATGFDHLVYGWIFFVFILIALFTLGHFWQDPVPVKSEMGVMLNATPLRMSTRLVTLIGGMLVLSVLSLWYSLKGSATPYNTPLYAGDIVQENDVLGPQFPLADSVTVETIKSEIRLYKIVYASESVDKKLISYQNRWFDGGIWSVAETERFTHDGTDFTAWKLADLSGRKSTLIFSYCVGGHWYNNNIYVKVGQVKSRLLGTDRGGRAFAWFALDDHGEKQHLSKAKMDKLCSL
jgi:exosortase A